MDVNLRGPSRLFRLPVLGSLHGVAVFALLFDVTSAHHARADVYRVNAASIAPHRDGLTWETAFADLQDALNAGLVNGDEIWVAGGVGPNPRHYYPDRIAGTDTNDQSLAFQLPTLSGAADPGIKILGGFSGTEASSLARDPEKYITILSGDIDQDGLLDPDNSWHVVRGSGVSSSSRIILDGFTITMGYADGNTDENKSGAGISVFEPNYGAGNPRITNCIIEKNHATAVGGGAHFYHAKGVLINCTFRENSTDNWGGGLYVAGGWDDPEASTTDVIRCRFINNTAVKYAGGMQIANASPTLVDCLFYDNQVTGQAPGYGGGAMSIDCADMGDDTVGCALTNPVIINCTFADNAAAAWPAIGGGIITTAAKPLSKPHFANCIFFGNVDSLGGDSASDMERANLSHNGDYPPTVIDSLIEAIVDGGDFDMPGNMAGDPQFVSSVAANYRLQEASPCIDAGVNASLPPDEHDLDDDGDLLELVPFDLDREVRISAGPNSAALAGPRDSEPGDVIVDMGAYEYRVDATPNCAGDTNHDGVVDPLDSGYVLSLFNCPVGTGNNACDEADANGDLIVDPLDVGFVLTRMGTCNN